MPSLIEDYKTTHFDVVLKAETTSVLISGKNPGVIPHKVPSGVKAAFVGICPVAGSEIGTVIWSGFFPSALKAKKYQFLLKPLVVGHGLENLQDDMEKGKARRYALSKKLTRQIEPLVEGEAHRHHAMRQQILTDLVDELVVHRAKASGSL